MRCAAIGAGAAAAAHRAAWAGATKRHSEDARRCVGAVRQPVSRPLGSRLRRGAPGMGGAWWATVAVFAAGAVVGAAVSAGALWRARRRGSGRGGGGEDDPLAAHEWRLRGKRGVCVFMGSSGGKRPEYLAAAREVGRELAERGLALVYGGGDIGLMGAVARSVHEHGGTVVGVIPKALSAREVAGEGVQLDNCVFTDSMHERKAVMASLASAFVVLPGGFGTFEEMCEMVTWTQLGIHNKSVGLLNVCGFYDRLHGAFEHAVAEGFIGRERLGILVMKSSTKELLDELVRHKAPKGLLNTWSSSYAQS